MSWSDTQPHYINRRIIIRDLIDSERLYVAAAGNLDQDKVQGNQVLYPAGYPEVLGVTGLWAEYNTTTHETSWFSRDNGDFGSNYYMDDQGQPLLRKYPVSAIYGIVETVTPLNHSPEQVERSWSRVTSTPIANDPVSLYDPFSGTSFACPQVTALAALLFEQYPSKTWEQVRARIILKRNTLVEQDPTIHQYQLAGPVQFHEALAPNW